MVEFINQIRKYPHRFLETGALFTSFIGLGFSLGVVGPTLLDLQTQVQRELSEVAYALPARAGGYALGSLISESTSFDTFWSKYLTNLNSNWNQQWDSCSTN
jgi:hypothetical protein